MRIDLNPGSGIERAQSTKPEPQRSNAGGAASKAELGSVQFETSIGKLTESVLNFAEVRQGKVQALKAQIEDGTYQVSDHNIAGALLEQMRRV